MSPGYGARLAVSVIVALQNSTGGASVSYAGAKLVIARGLLTQARAAPLVQAVQPSIGPTSGGTYVTIVGRLVPVNLWRALGTTRCRADTLPIRVCCPCRRAEAPLCSCGTEHVSSRACALRLPAHTRPLCLSDDVLYCFLAPAPTTPSGPQLQLPLQVIAANQSQTATVTFSFYFFTSFAPLCGPALRTRLVVAGGGFTSGLPLLRAAPAVATFVGARASDSAMVFILNVSDSVLPGAAAAFQLSASLNGADWTPVGSVAFNAYITTVTNATAVSGPVSGGTRLELTGELAARIRLPPPCCERRALVRVGQGSSSTPARPRSSLVRRAPARPPRTLAGSRRAAWWRTRPPWRWLAPCRCLSLWT
jgi:hypothetical protein